MYCDGVNHWNCLGVGWNFRDVIMFTYAEPCPAHCPMHCNGEVILVEEEENNEQKD